MKESRRARREGRAVSAAAARPAAAAALPGPGAGLPGWLWPLAIAVLVALFFAPVLFGGRVFSSPDAQAPQGFAVYVQEHGCAGCPPWSRDYPLWNPFIFCGMPSFASLAYNPGIYVPDLPLKLLGSLAPPMLWLVLYYLVGALALYAFLRDRGAEPWPAALAGLVFALTPNLIAVGGHGHGSQLVCSAWLPVVLLCLHRWLARGGLHWLGALALAVGCQLLRAHMQIAYYTWMVVAIYLVFYGLARRRGREPFATPLVAGVGGTLAALGLGLALAAVLVLPVAGYAPESIRGAGTTGGVDFAYATGWSMSPLELVTLVVPGALGFGGATYWGSMPFTDFPNAYLGIVTLCCIGLGLLLTRGRGMGVFVTLALVGIVVALGRHTPVYGLLYDHLPQWKKFRVPVMILVVAHLAGVSMMALGLTALLRLARRPSRGGGAAADRWSERLVGLLRWKAVAGLALLVLLVLTAAGFRHWYQGRFLASPRIAGYVQAGRLPGAQAASLAAEAARGAHRDLVRNLALASLALGGAALLLRRRLPPAAYLGGLSVLVAIDLLPIDRRILAPVTQPRAALAAATARDATIDFLTAQLDGPPFRILPLDALTSNRYATFGLASVGGYHAAKPAVYQQFMSAAGLESGQIFRSAQGFRLLDFLAVRYLVTRQRLPDSARFRLVHDGPERVYENTQAAPRAFLVGAVEVQPAGPRTLARLTAPDFDPLRVALVERPPGALAGAAEPEALGSVRFGRQALNHLELEVEAQGAALLVLSDTYSPRWRVRVDGAPRPLWRVDHAFRGVHLAAGRHRVQFDYVDLRLRAGLLTALVAAVVVLALLVIGTRRAAARAAAPDLVE